MSANNVEVCTPLHWRTAGLCHPGVATSIDRTAGTATGIQGDSIQLGVVVPTIHTATLDMSAASVVNSHWHEIFNCPSDVQ